VKELAMRPARQTCRGFTLVELSIVLVIIGLIIGGVLTGQQIIQNARITNAVQSIQAYQGQLQTYAQNYGALPGDDPSASARFPNAKTANGGGNGTIGTGDSFATFSAAEGEGAGESRLVWAHLRAAELVKNQVTNNSTAIQPSNPFGGIFGFQNGAFSGAFTTTVLCMNKLPAGASQAIDARLDDGNSDKGAIQAAAETSSGSGNSSGAAATSYTDGQTYTLCIRM
jgi:prepilin-type N-terminal cleavage/methylation domain-containing protein